jgi:hypothetical protein
MLFSRFGAIVHQRTQKEASIKCREEKNYDKKYASNHSRHLVIMMTKQLSLRHFYETS